MKYNIEKGDWLSIKNEYGLTMCIINKHNCWIKSEYDQNGKLIYFEDHRGNIRHYKKYEI